MEGDESLVQPHLHSTAWDALDPESRYYSYTNRYLDRLEIIEDCYLPHDIKNLTPIIELKYKLSELGEHLKI